MPKACKCVQGGRRGKLGECDRDFTLHFLLLKTFLTTSSDIFDSFTNGTSCRWSNDNL